MISHKKDGENQDSQFSKLFDRNLMMAGIHEPGQTKSRSCRVDKRSASTMTVQQGGCAALIHPAFSP